MTMTTTKISSQISRYTGIQDELRSIFQKKIRQYGIGMYEAHSNQFKYWAAFFNIRRKTLRLERLTELALQDMKYHYQEVEEARAKLIDDYKDIANYAIMAVQILEEKNDANRPDSNS